MSAPRPTSTSADPPRGCGPAWERPGARPAVRLDVSVVPNAKRTGADGRHDGALRVRLAAPPVDGKANEVLIAWLADELGVPKRSVTLLRGQSARRKQLAIDVPAQQLGEWLARVAPP